jgi:hypothetical protein
MGNKHISELIKIAADSYSHLSVFGWVEWVIRWLWVNAPIFHLSEAHLKPLKGFWTHLDGLSAQMSYHGSPDSILDVTVETEGRFTPKAAGIAQASLPDRDDYRTGHNHVPPSPSLSHTHRGQWQGRYCSTVYAHWAHFPSIFQSGEHHFPMLCCSAGSQFPYWFSVPKISGELIFTTSSSAHLPSKDITPNTLSKSSLSLLQRLHLMNPSYLGPLAPQSLD